MGLEKIFLFHMTLSTLNFKKWGRVQTTWTEFWAILTTFRPSFVHVVCIRPLWYYIYHNSIIITIILRNPNVLRFLFTDIDRNHQPKISYQMPTRREQNNMCVTNNANRIDVARQNKS